MFITLFSVKSPVKYIAESSAVRLVPNVVARDINEYIKPGHSRSKLIEPASQMIRWTVLAGLPGSVGPAL